MMSEKEKKEKTPGTNPYTDTLPLMSKPSKLDDLKEKGEDIIKNVAKGTIDFMTARTGEEMGKAVKQVYNTVVKGYTTPPELKPNHPSERYYGACDRSLEGLDLDKETEQTEALRSSQSSDSSYNPFA